MQNGMRWGGSECATGKHMCRKARSACRATVSLRQTPSEGDHTGQSSTGIGAPFCIPEGTKDFHLQGDLCVASRRGLTCPGIA